MSCGCVKGDRGPQGEQGIQGIQGDTGPQGPQGPAGPVTGVVGPQGPQGDTGSQGVPGPAGSSGVNGENGLNGTNGTDGTDGTDGLNVYQGVGVPLVSLGVDDETYIDSSNGDLYKKTAGAWVLTGNLYSGALVGVDGLFNAGRATDITLNNTVGVYLPITVTDGAGNYNYAIKWNSDEWTSPGAHNFKAKGEFNFECAGAGGGFSHSVRVEVYKNDVLDHTITLGDIVDNVAGSSTFIFEGSDVAVVADDAINIRLITNQASGKSQITFKAGSILFNELN